MKILLLNYISYTPDLLIYEQVVWKASDGHLCLSVQQFNFTDFSNISMIAEGQVVLRSLCNYVGVKWDRRSHPHHKESPTPQYTYPPKGQRAEGPLRRSALSSLYYCYLYFYLYYYYKAESK
jgi:hypothetical protein